VLSKVTPAASLPVTLTDLKDHLNIAFDDDDVRLDILNTLATEFVEAETCRNLVDTTWDDVRPCFPTSDNPAEMRRSPLQSVTSVTYFDSSNESTVWGSTNYYVVTPDNSPGFLQAKSSYPSIFARPDAVTYRFVSGYGTVPEQAKHAIKLVAGHWNENREAMLVGTIATELQFGLERLLDHLRTGNYA